MKTKIKNFFAGKDNRTGGLIAFALVMMIVLGCNCNKEGGFSFGEAQVPAEPELERLVQGTMQDFTNAIQAGDFTAFHAKASSDFQKQFTVDALNTAFGEFIRQKQAVVPVLRSTATLKPLYSPAPSTGTEKLTPIMDVNGKYDTKPVPTNFKLRYVQDGGQWKLIQIRIELQ